MKELQLTIRGITPLLLHSERLANPFDPLTKEIKALTGKRKKTEDDLNEISRLEWLGGLYFQDNLGPVIPGYNVFAALQAGGKLHKLGSAIKRAAIVKEDQIPLSYVGPRDPDALFSNKGFVDVRSVKVGTSKVIRCRPVFKQWELRFSVLYEESTLQADDLMRVAVDTGHTIGLGDYRPRFGRFEVVQ